MGINLDEFFTKVHSERAGRDVLVSPLVFWEIAQRLMAKVELFTWNKASERGTEIIRVTEDATGEQYLLVSDPDAPAHKPFYAKVTP